MSVGTVAVRGVVGPLFIGHGAQKLFGWFGGGGPDATGEQFEQLGLRPGRRHAIAAGVAEASGGLLLTLGALTPLAATVLSSTMVTAIRKVHAPNGPWVTNQGWEYNATLIAAVAMVADHGPGRPSVDDRLLPRLKGPGWAVASLAAAVAGSYLVDRLSAADGDQADPDTPTGDAADQARQDAEREARFAREHAASPAEG